MRLIPDEADVAYVEELLAEASQRTREDEHFKKYLMTTVEVDLLINTGADVMHYGYEEDCGLYLMELQLFGCSFYHYAPCPFYGTVIGH